MAKQLVDKYNTVWYRRVTEAFNGNRGLQSRIAEAIGLPQPTISALASGGQNPYLWQAAAIADAAGLSLDWLVGLGEQRGNSKSDSPPVPQPTDDEAYILQIIRDLGMSRQEAVNRIVNNGLTPVKIIQPVLREDADTVPGHVMPPDGDHTVGVAEVPPGKESPSRSTKRKSGQR